ncbi:hypothetical protein AMTRI_Chr09g42210 [Amborella trichopoda]|uniref:DUF668 domain-containing protein n=1 Tax=Amborella trichopoda TaxID=13333 RepID=W1Q067_AMBTC|nr:uncharacterized protein LOC18441514 [Amborella trichopoda]ERN13280.1 hypothetical protein AMTR_s00041p00036290 [Amborella trichopoda]|eukprot:XP_006851813.1 uncharacterized protein LOC18441514 [Amborella trichopoda]
MALESWLIKASVSLKSTLLNSWRRQEKAPQVGVLAFEIAGLMSRIMHLWRSLSDNQISRLKAETITLEGIRKIVSNDDSFLLSLACAEIAENLRLIAASVSRLGQRCRDPSLWSFDRIFMEFVKTGSDPNNWVMSFREMESKLKRMEKLVSATSGLYKEIEILSDLEGGLRKIQSDRNSNSNSKSCRAIDLHQKVVWQREEVRYLKESSIWGRSFDFVTAILARSVFTVFSRIRLVFSIETQWKHGSPLTRSFSATVYPSSENPNYSKPLMVKSGSLNPNEKLCNKPEKLLNKPKFFYTNSKLLNPPSSTLGASALALHYANLVLVIERLVRSPHLIGPDCRDDLYGMLPNTIRMALKSRLKAYSKSLSFSAVDPSLAGEWSKALERILQWLSPLAHNMIRWQSERNFEQQNLGARTSVLLLQTLYFANQEKVEAAITELLVGLNYIWRFERERNNVVIVEWRGDGEFDG